MDKKLIQVIQKFWQKCGFFLIPFIIFTFSLLFFDFLYLRYFSIALFKTKYIYAIIYAAFLASIVACFRKEKARRIVTLVLVVLVSLLYLVQGVHYRAFRSIALTSALLRLGDLAGATDSIWEFVSPDLVFFAFPTLIYSFYILLRNQSSDINFEKSRLKIAVILCICATLVLNLANYKMIVINGDTNKEFFRNSTEYLKRYGLIDTIMKEINKNVLQKDTAYEDAEVPKMEEAFRYIPEKNAVTDQYVGKNLVFIEAESIGPYAIDEKLTPSLYKLQQEGYNFTEYYSARINTFESEYALLNTFYLTPEKERVPFTSAGTMPTLFKEQNYPSQSFHNYLSSMYSRPLRHVELGFEQFYGAKDMGIVVDGGSNFPDDADLFANAFDLFAQTKNPFFSYMITVSAHAGYDASKREGITENLEQVKAVYPDYPSEVQTYLAAAMQTDAGVGILLDKLEEAGLYDDTVIVFVGDHYPYGLRGHVEEVFQVPNSLAQYKVPFMIWDSSKPAQSIDTLATNVDVLPTLSNMFALDLRYTMGQDLFSSNRSKVMVDWHGVRSYSFLTPTIGYDGDYYQTYGDYTEEEVHAMQELSYKREEWNNSEHVRNGLNR